MTTSEKAEMTTWWGRWPEAAIPPTKTGLWHEESIPVGETPWTWTGMPWFPIKVWLPHPPVRRRRR